MCSDLIHHGDCRLICMQVGPRRTISAYLLMLKVFFEGVTNQEWCRLKNLRSFQMASQYVYAGHWGGDFLWSSKDLLDLQHTSLCLKPWSHFSTYGLSGMGFGSDKVERNCNLFIAASIGVWIQCTRILLACSWCLSPWSRLSHPLWMQCRSFPPGLGACQSSKTVKDLAIGCNITGGLYKCGYESHKLM